MTHNSVTIVFRMLIISAFLTIIALAVIIVLSLSSNAENRRIRADIITPPYISQCEAWMRKESTPEAIALFDKAAIICKQHAGYNSDLANLSNRLTRKAFAIDDDGAPMDDEQAYNKASALLAPLQDTIADIKSLATDGGLLYPLDISHGRSKSDKEHCFRLVEMIYLLQLDAMCSDHAGDSGKVINDIDHIMNLGDSIAQEPTILAQIIRASAYERAMSTLTSAFTPGELRQEHTNQILTHIRCGLHHEAFKEALQGELYFYIKSPRFDNLLALHSPGRKTGMMELLINTGQVPILSARADTNIIKGMELIITLMDKPYWEITLQPEYERIRKTRIPIGDMDYTVNEFTDMRTRHEALLGLLETGLLAELQAAQTGAAPATISFAGAAATDPFTGKPFVYKPDGATFVLYSLGPDQEDDGGQVNQNARDEGDIPWRGEL